MTRTVKGVLGGALLALWACGPLDDGGGMEGPPCQDVSDCASDGCCGAGTAAVAASEEPMCPTSCTNGRQPHSLCVNNGSGLVTCDLGKHCSVALGAPGSCTN